MIGFGKEMKHFLSEAGHDEVALWKRPETRAFTYKWGDPRQRGETVYAVKVLVGRAFPKYGGGRLQFF
jgi:hypothetical protein